MAVLLDKSPVRTQYHAPTVCPLPPVALPPVTTVIASFACFMHTHFGPVHAGGSCRLPASMTGVIGFRPTTGCWQAADGIVPMSTTRDTVGTCRRAFSHLSLAPLFPSALALTNSQAGHRVFDVPCTGLQMLKCWVMRRRERAQHGGRQAVQQPVQRLQQGVPARDRQGAARGRAQELLGGPRLGGALLQAYSSHPAVVPGSLPRNVGVQKNIFD